MIAWIDVRGVAKQLDVKEQTARNLMNSGKLQACKIGSAYKTQQQWIDDYIERQKVVVQVTK